MSIHDRVWRIFECAMTGFSLGIGLCVTLLWYAA